MRKFSLGVVLFVAVVVLSYLKVTYSSSESRDELSAILLQKEADSLHAVAIIDSLSRKLEDSRSELREFVALQDKTVGRASDSMSLIIEKQRARIGKLTEDLTSARTRLSRMSKKQRNTDGAGLPDSRAVAEYFKKQIAKLPADLSDYERRIMIDEVRENVLKRFSITPKQFERIKKEQKLSF